MMHSAIKLKLVQHQGKIESEKELREQLHTEIEKKSKACSNPTYECTIPRLDGYEYCIRHILRDHQALYKQCTYVYSNGKKCQQAAPKHDIKKDPSLTTFCFEHSRLAQLTKARLSAGKCKQIENNATLLGSLAHHIVIPTPATLSPFATELDEEIDVVSPNISGFVSFEHIADLDVINSPEQKKRRIREYPSDSSDSDAAILGNRTKCREWDDSENESIDSQDSDHLRHAGIYTTEEALAISKKKLKTLQKLYVNQISRLHHILKDKRRSYLQSIRKERETLCSIHDQPKRTTAERRQYEKLKALNHYHRRNGMEAILLKKYRERCSRSVESFTQKGSSFSKCFFSEGGVKCAEKAMPCCKYCKKHILEDKKQILFRACRVEKSGVICQEPVANIFEDSTCVLHINLPTKRQYVQKKFESETEDDDDETLAPLETVAAPTTTTTTTTSTPTATPMIVGETTMTVTTELIDAPIPEMNFDDEAENQEFEGEESKEDLIMSLRMDTDTSIEADVVEESQENVTISHIEHSLESTLSPEAASTNITTSPPHAEEVASTETPALIES